MTEPFPISLTFEYWPIAKVKCGYNAKNTNRFTRQKGTQLEFQEDFMLLSRNFRFFNIPKLWAEVTITLI